MVTAVTDGEGMWHARNLPAAPLRLLIGAQSAIAGGSYDAMAATIRYPWSSSHIVTAVD